MSKNNNYDFSFRCPRCGGFLYKAEKLDIPRRFNPEKAMGNGKKPKKYFSEMFICINCGRIWNYDGKDLYLYPQGTPAKEVELKKS